MTQALDGLSDHGLGQGTVQGIILVPPLHGDLDGGEVPGHAAHAHAVGVISGMTHRGGAAGADPLAAAVMAFGLILEALLEIFDKLLGRHFFQLRFIDAQGIGQELGILEPGIQQASGHFIQGESLLIRHFRTLEMMGKHLIEKVKIPLAFHQNGPGCRVKISQTADQTLTKRPVQG